MSLRRRISRDITTAVDRSAAEAGFALDPAQRAVRDRLLVLAEDLLAPGLRRRRPRGLYVWGDSGRGKSWLLDAYFQALPTEAKRRVHFHGFFDQLHRRIHDHQGEADAVERAVASLTDGVRVLYFDEFHVHDAGDGTLLIRLLRRLFRSKVVLLVSSNYAPGSLLPNPLWHHIFEPGIELILKNMDTVRLAGPADYRSRQTPADAGFSSGAWIAPGTGTQLQRLGLAAPRGPEPASIRVGSRDFEVTALRPGELWCTFTQACEAETSSIEFLEWTRRFDRFILTDVPSFRDVDPAGQQRFINLVDILSDSDTPSYLTSELDYREFRLGAEDRPDAFRMLSRLQLLQGADA